jgi:hypothetical protein
MAEIIGAEEIGTEGLEGPDSQYISMQILKS